MAAREPLTLDAQQIYRGLSDADAAAASAFLSGGLEPAAARQRYDADISQAALGIEAAAALVGPSGSASKDLAALSAGLPVYAGEVGTALADNRLGLPLGVATCGRPPLCYAARCCRRPATSTPRKAGC